MIFPYYAGGEPYCGLRGQ